MSNDEKPPEKPTVKMETVPDWAVALTTGFASVKDSVTSLGRELSADIKLVSNDLGILNDRVGILESARNDGEQRAARTSQRVAQASQVDLEHEAKLGLALAALAEEKAKREKLEADAATKEDVKKMLDAASTTQTEAIVTGVKTFVDEAKKSPAVKRITSVAIPLLLLAMGVIGLRLEAEMSRLRAASQSQPTVVQLAPVTVYADAGASDK